VAGCGPATGGVGAVVGAARATLSQWASSSSTFTSAETFGATGKPARALGAFAFPRGLGYEAIAPPPGQSGGTLYLDLLPTVAYINSLRGVPLPKGKIWIIAPIAGPVSSHFPRFVEQVEGLNPELLLDEIIWGATAISSQGQSVLNHVPYSRYDVTVSLSRALARATGDSAMAMRLAISDELQALAGGGQVRSASSVQITAWVDGPGRVARLQADIPGAGLGTVTVSLSNFGTSFLITLPPRDLSVRIESLLRAFRSPWVFAGGV
jgi:hypothetical protein